ncbi:MAG: hypothetical protein ACE5EQ_12460 [Phycisphaerae bacterium]
MRRMHITTSICGLLGAIAMCLAFTSVVMKLALIRLDDLRWAVGHIESVVVSKDAVFLANDQRRVYKFALDGTVIDWVSIGGTPLHITRSGDSIIVHQSTNEWAMEDPGFRVRDPVGFTATVERTWYGHPMLAVDRAGVKTRVSMQPWYMTLLQAPYPGMFWVWVGFAFIFLAQCARRRLRRLKQAAGSPGDSGKEVACSRGR